ncbi:MAG: dipeptidase [Gemmatimonadaceae bacterium]|nr:dipeptidase [Gemmatimonadaceae bacterium]
MIRRLLGALSAVLLIAVVIFFVKGADLTDRSMNKVTVNGPYQARPAAESLLRTLQVVDLHADALLWPRDLLDRHDYGHVDLPRLQQGQVALQVFSVVTKTPRGINYERNTDETDNITILALAERYPMRAWFSLRERAQWQAARLRDAVARSRTGKDGTPGLALIRSRRDLDELLASRAAHNTVGALLATEGLHPLEGRIANLDTLVAAGFRMFGLTHFFDNEIGGSAHGVEKSGLTPFGRQVVARLDSLGMIIDLAHASSTVFDEVLALGRRPVVVSHGGVQGTCKGPRNLSDDQLRRLAAKGGMLGIGYWDGAICDPTAAAFAKAVVYAVGVAGDDHVGLGSDFDGSTVTPFDASAMGLVVQALQDAGLSDVTIGKVMGGNAIRLLRELLPPH